MTMVLLVSHAEDVKNSPTVKICNTVIKLDAFNCNNKDMITSVQPVISSECLCCENVLSKFRSFLCNALPKKNITFAWAFL